MFMNARTLFTANLDSSLDTDNNPERVRRVTTGRVASTHAHRSMHVHTSMTTQTLTWDNAAGMLIFEAQAAFSTTG